MTCLSSVLVTTGGTSICQHPLGCQPCRLTDKVGENGWNFTIHDPKQQNASESFSQGYWSLSRNAPSRFQTERFARSSYPSSWKSLLTWKRCVARVRHTPPEHSEQGKVARVEIFKQLKLAVVTSKVETPQSFCCG